LSSTMEIGMAVVPRLPHPTQPIVFDDDKLRQGQQNWKIFENAIILRRRAYLPIEGPMERGF
jgi:hypothetical protein